MTLPLKERIKTALKNAGGSMTYHELMVKCFPLDEYQNSWRYQSNGGPPGCAMAFGRALRELGCIRIGAGGGSKVLMPSNAQVHGRPAVPCNVTLEPNN